MTQAGRDLWYEGRDLWFEYVTINGFSSTFNDEGLKKLSKNLDLNAGYIRERLLVYLEN